MLDDVGDLFSITAVDLVDLFDETAVGLHESRVEAVLLGEAFEVGHAHARVQIVGAGGQDVFARTRILVGDDWIYVGIEEHRLEPFQQCLHRLA